MLIFQHWVSQPMQLTSRFHRVHEQMNRQSGDQSFAQLNQSNLHSDHRVLQRWTSLS